jgi:hypothetical protein
MSEETETLLSDPPPAADPPPANDPPAQTSLLDEPPKPEEPAFGADPLDAEKFKSLLPEGFAADEELSAKFLEAVNSAPSREAFAQQMISLQTEMLTKAETAATEAWEATQTAWKNEVTSDPEFGGDKLQTSLATARTLIETHAKDQAEAKAIKEFFALTGAGNSIHMVRLLNRLAARIPGEAKPVEGTPAPTDLSRAERLFGKT